MTVPEVDAYQTTKERNEQLDRLIRRLLFAFLTFALVIFMAGVVALGFYVESIHTNQINFHNQSEVQQKALARSEAIIACQNGVFDQILADLPAFFAPHPAGTPSPAASVIRKGETC